MTWGMVIMAAVLWCAVVAAVAGWLAASSATWNLRTRRRLQADGAGVTAAPVVPDWVERFADRTSIDVPPATLWLWIRAGAAGLIVVAVLRSSVTTVSLLVGTGAVSVAAVRLLRSRRTASPRPLADVTELLAARLESGTTATAALQIVAAEDVVGAGDGHDLLEVVESIGEGTMFQRALDDWAGRDGTGGRRLVADAWAVAGATGASAAAALTRAGDTLRERDSLEREIGALGAQARMSARVLTAVPIGFAVVVTLVDDRVSRFLLGSPGGWLCVVGGLLLDAGGALWMRRMVEGIG